MILPRLTPLVFLFAVCCAGESAKPPIPAPPAGVAAYAKEHGLEPTVSLDLNKGVKLELVLIPPGKFMMGSPETEKDRKKNETQHEVTISKPFYMGRYEVTQEQYEATMGRNPSEFKGAKNPVETVTWEDAQEFCKEVSAKTRKTVRLPTEAQWEYACRAGTTTRFYSGDADADLDGVGWYDSNSEQRTHPVGEKKPNSWGLYDVHGNVSEWCQDGYKEYSGGVTRKADRECMVLRGGSWYVYARVCRSAFRDIIPPHLGFSSYGFRVVLATKP
jgi:formylglycine-generating enzyme required for sulfatase activity